MDIAGFLKARITEDESLALGAGKESAEWHATVEETADRDSIYHTVAMSNTGSDIAEMNSIGDDGMYAAEHTARWDPARVLAECSAKRAIIELHHPFNHHGEHGDYAFCTACQWDHGSDEPRTDMGIAEYGHPCQTLRALATIYADHPGFQEAWRA